MTCERCGRTAIGRRGATWCPCGWSEDAHAPSAAEAVEEPVARRRSDLHVRIGRRWTPNELAFLYRNRNALSIRALSTRLGRSPHAVEQKLHKSGWRKRRRAPGAAVAGVAQPGHRWTDAEVLSVLTGSLISQGRSSEAVRAKLRRDGEGGLRQQDGMLSGAEVARAYAIPVSRVYAARRAGKLRGVWRFNSWRFDPAEIEGVGITGPKATWRGYPPDTGDYRHRYSVRQARR